MIPPSRLGGVLAKFYQLALYNADSRPCHLPVTKIHKPSRGPVINSWGGVGYKTEGGGGGGVRF